MASKETLILTEPTKNSTFDFRMTFTGLKLIRNLATSDYQLVDATTGEVVFDVGRLIVTDSAYDDKAGQFGTCDSAYWEVVEGGDGWATIRANVDKNWIKDKARVWPVKVDPTLYVNLNKTVPTSPIASSADTYVSSRYPTTAYPNTTEMHIGYYDATTGNNRGLTNFALPDLSGMRIDSVKLVVQQFHQYYTSASTETYVATLKGSAPTINTTWNTMPAVATWAVGRFTTTQRVQLVNFDITAAMAPYLRRETTFYGLTYYQSEAGDQNTTHWRKYYTKYSGNGAVLTSIYYPDLQPVTNLSYTTKASTDWFKEVDTNGDNLADNVNDRPEQGRGSVSLTWNADPQAKGYVIYAFDGNAYNVVGKTVGKSATTWSSEGGGVFPRGSDIKGYAQDCALNTFISASTPCDESVIIKTALSMPAGSGTTLTGAGTIAFDGDDMYVKKWATYPGPDQWVQFKKSGMSGGATSVPTYYAGKKIATTQAGTTSKSGFTLNGILYDGYATRVSGGTADIAGFVLSSIMDKAVPVTLTLSAPPILYHTGAEATAATDALLLASDGSRIYSAGKTATGFKVRIYDELGKFIADKTYTLEGQAAYAYFDGFTVAGDNLYFYEWTATALARMTKASIARTKIVNQWYIQSQPTYQNVSVVYDKKTNRFVMGQLQAGASLYSYSGPGEDLQDDPRTLYRKTKGTTYDAYANYWFRVCPYSDYESMPPNSSTCAKPTLENRTVRVTDASQRQYREIAQVAGESIEGALSVPRTRLRTEDFRIASTGPAARLGRTYLSDMTYTSAWLPKGWMFSFEENAVASGTNVIYTAPSGVSYTFIKGVDNTFVAPNGLFATLTYDAGTVVAGRNTYILTFPDGYKKIFDAASGKIISETDRIGKKVSYDFTATSVTITAANGQKITITQTGTGTFSAVYTTASGTREIDYSVAGTTLSVKAYPATTSEITRVYTLSTQKLTKVTAASDTVTIAYATTTLTAEHSAAAVPPERNKLTYAATTNPNVKLTTFDSGSTAAERGFAAGSERTIYLLNAAQQVIWKSISVAGDEGESYRYNSENQMIGTASPTYYTITASDITFQVKTSAQLTEELFTFDGKGYLIEHTSKQGGVTENFYNAAGDLIKQIDESRSVIWRSYSSKGLLLVEEKLLAVSGEKSRTEYTYDSTGNLTQARAAIRKVGDVYEWATTQYASFAPCGAPQKITALDVMLSSTATAQSLIEARVYNQFGDLTKDTQPTGAITQASYDIAGKLITATTPGGAVMHITYDNVSNPVDIYKTATGISGKYEWSRQLYDTSGNNTATQVFDPDGAELSKTIYTLDVMGREVATDDSNVAGAEKTKYDQMGNVIEKSAEALSANVVELTQYDSLNRPVFQNTAAVSSQGEWHEYDDHSLIMYCMHGGVIYKVQFDKAGNRVSVEKYSAVPGKTPSQATAGQTPLQTTKSAYDLNARPISVIESKLGAQALTYTHLYDLMGRETSVQLGGQAATTYTYNTLGWLLAEKDFDGITTTYVYNENGELLEQNRGGLKSTTTYNSDGQITSSTGDDGTTINYTYDSLGRLTRETHIKGSAAVKDVTIAYDAKGQVASTTDAVAQYQRTYSYERSGVGEAAHLKVTATDTFSDGTQATSVIDGGYFASGALSSAGVQNLQATVTRDDAKRVTSTTIGTAQHTLAYNKVTGLLSFDSALSKAGETTYAYTADYTLQATTYGNISQSAAYTYSADKSQLSKATIGATSTSYTYSALTGDITAAGTNGFTYNAQGRLATRTGAAATYTYDSLGRRTKGAGGTTYTWSGQRLASVTPVNAPDEGAPVGGTPASTGPTTAIYTYDGGGQRISKQVANTKTSYVYSGLQLLSLTQISPNATKSLTYLYGAGSTPVGARYHAGSAAPTDFEIVSDMHGDVRELRDRSGAVFARYNFDAYGNIISDQTFATSLITLAQAQAISTLQPLRYAGYVFDTETGLYYCSQRYYDPSTASFISKDPAKADGEKSAYGYCGGDPANWVDPSGLITSNARTYIPADQRQQIAYQAAVTSRPTFDGCETGHVWKDAPTLYYKCACCGKIYRSDGSQVFMIPDGLDDNGTEDLWKAELAFAIGSAAAGGFFLPPWEAIIAGSGPVAQKAADTVSTIDPVFGSSAKSAGTLASQMATRGWTEGSVTQLANDAYQFGDTINRANQNPATAYFAQDGSYVVIDDVTREVVQVSDKIKPGWVVDPGITNIRLVK